MGKQYRVVETNWKGGERVERDIGCAWKSEAKAKAELRALQPKFSRLLSLQRKR